MGNTAQQLKTPDATYEDLLTVPEHLTAEIIDGELHTQPRPAPKHAWASSMLGGTLFPPFSKSGGGSTPGGWVIMFEPEIHIGSKPHILVPDLAGWRRERFSELPDEAWIDIVPDWVCEVISPSTAIKDRVKKMPVYAREGVEFLWLVDPRPQTLEAYRLYEGQWLQIGAWAEDDVIRVEPFDAVELELGSLWSI